MPDDNSNRIRVFIQDHTGNKTREVRVARDVGLQQLVPALITALGMPVTDASGSSITYHLAYQDRQLGRDETMSSAQVGEGAYLSLVPEMTAGVEVDHA